MYIVENFTAASVFIILSIILYGLLQSDITALAEFVLMVAFLTTVIIAIISFVIMILDLIYNR